MPRVNDYLTPFNSNTMYLVIFNSNMGGNDEASSLHLHLPIDDEEQLEQRLQHERLHCDEEHVEQWLQRLVHLLGLLTL
jgi:hypothetical protein